MLPSLWKKVEDNKFKKKNFNITVNDKDNHFFSLSQTVKYIPEIAYNLAFKAKKMCKRLSLWFSVLVKFFLAQ